MYVVEQLQQWLYIKSIRFSDVVLIIYFCDAEVKSLVGMPLDVAMKNKSKI